VLWCDRWARTATTQQKRHQAQCAFNRTLLINTRATDEMWTKFNQKTTFILTDDVQRLVQKVKDRRGTVLQRLARVDHLGALLTEQLTQIAKETLGTRRRCTHRKPQAPRDVRTRCQQLGRIVAVHHHHTNTATQPATVVAKARQLLSTRDPLFPPPLIETQASDYTQWLQFLRTALSAERKCAKKQATRAKHEIIQAAQQKRCEDLFNNLGGFVRNAMGRARDRVQIDRVIVTNHDSGVPMQEYSADPDIILSTTQQVFSDWTSPRNPQIERLMQDPFWHDIYQPREDIAEDTWDPLLQPVSSQELSSLLHAVAGGKTPGPSQLSYDLLRHADEDVQVILLALINEVILLSDMPASWLKHDICPIPKPGWNGDINRTRPISLVEVLRKLVEKILNTRLATILESRQVLQGENAGFMPRSGLDELLWMLRGVLDDAKARSKEIWLVLLDIQRAYDHVSGKGLSQLWYAFGHLRLLFAFFTICGRNAQHMF
jgi:hypothetical protein